MLQHRPAGTTLARGAFVIPAFRRFVATLAVILLGAGVTLFAQATVTELNDAGWKALQNGYADRAATLFGQALAMRPDDPVLLLGAGASAQARGNAREAMTQLKRALERDPKLTPASRLLGEIAFAEGDADLAIRTFEAALRYAPGDPALTGELNAWRRETALHERFEEQRFDRFRVMFQGRENGSIATDATRVLNSEFWRIGGKLGEYPPDTIVTVLYTEAQFRDITRAPDWSDGEYDGRIRVPVAGASSQPGRFEHVLTHELTHAMIAGIAPRGVPVWLHEGLAQYFDGSDPQAARRRLQASGRRMPLASLEQPFGRFGAADAQIAYDESLIAVAAMFDRPTFGWGRLLHAVGDGQPFERTLASFGFSYADLEARFR
jgi:hypothetical protein